MTPAQRYWFGVTLSGFAGFWLLYLVAILLTAVQS